MLAGEDAGKQRPVRRSERTDTPVGYGPRDHLCWVYRRDSAWHDAAVPFLRDGIVGGDRLLYAADKDEEALLDDLAGLPERDALLDAGQLEVRPLAEAYAALDGRFDIGAQVATFEQMSLAALADGYRSLRLAADLTALVASDDAVHRVVSYELLVDAMGARRPWTALCGYDLDRIGAPAARAMCFVHPVHRDGEEAVPARLHAGEAGKWCLAGEVDVATHEALRTALATLPGAGPVHLDVSSLEHIDVAGVRALAALAVMLAPAGGLVLHRPPDILAWMLDTWGDVPGLQVRP